MGRGIHAKIRGGHGIREKTRTVFDGTIDKNRLPRHIAIIMDGNGRWAKRQHKTRIQGHEAGSRAVREVIESCRKLGVPALSLYAFSTENWRRSKTEVNALFHLLSKYIRREIDELHANNVRVRFMGRTDRIPKAAWADFAAAMERTKDNTALDVCIALNYGGRAEIVDAARHIAEAVKAGTLDPAQLDEVAFAKYLYIPEYSEVDLLIRTSGELRLSNFMLWQVSYAEITVPDVLWPDFSHQHLLEAIAAYQQRDRRFGGRP